jgi:ergothioneine biosynthesis protein EgtB
MNDHELAQHLLAAFAAARTRTEQIFAVVAPAAYDERPIPLRHPIRFYDGHLDAFNFNTLCRGVLGQASFAPELDALFARGIDPEDDAASAAHRITCWPAAAEVRAYKEAAGQRVRQALIDPGIFASGPFLRRGKLFYLLLEHELMHQETLLYLLHQLPYDQKQPPPGISATGEVPGPGPKPQHMAAVPAGKAVEDEIDFGWDNEFPRHEVDVPRFRMDVHNVQNGQFLEFVEAGGYTKRDLWDDAAWALWHDERHRPTSHPIFWRHREGQWFLRGLFSEQPLPMSFPVQVTHAEARAYARFVGKRLPTEAEWHRAAFGDDPERRYPWGGEPPDPSRGNFDFACWSATRVGAFPKGQSPFGIHDLVGNGWEWTDTVFLPFPGFSPFPPYPGYSADFFDGKHYVLKGGSCFTDARLLRRSFRNWFFWHYPFAYATFRCASSS